MNELLAENNVHVDFSCCLGLDPPRREAIWVEPETSGYYLPKNPRQAADGTPRPSMFEIPIGSDGGGAAYRNLLHVEQSQLENLVRVLAAVVGRAEREGRPQIVHSLFHTGSMGQPENVECFKRFLDHVSRNGGAFVSSLEAKRIHDTRAGALKCSA
jgi:hypothetical protein